MAAYLPGYALAMRLGSHVGLSAISFFVSYILNLAPNNVGPWPLHLGIEK
jgi:hypothetical protein